jgi:hypothetical protein
VAAQGRRPALSYDGNELAFSRAPYLVPESSACAPSPASYTDLQLVVLNLATGQTKSLPMLQPSGFATTAPPDGASVISHLSWSPDGSHLAVTTQEGGTTAERFAVSILYPLTAGDYDGETTAYVPMPTPTDPTDNAAVKIEINDFYREAVYQPDGYLFVVRECCQAPSPNARVPPEYQPESVELLEIGQTTGTVARTVANGLTNRDHNSLNVSADGHWLLYLSGQDLEVSHAGATPSILATGLLAAAW